MEGHRITQATGHEEAAEIIDAQEFLQTHGLEQYSDRMVADHEGKPMPLERAIVECQSARKAIEAAVTMAEMVGEEQRSGMFDAFFDKLSNDAQGEDVKKK